MSSQFDRLRERKLVQWAIAYLAGAWVVFEVSDAVGSRWGLPDVIFQGLIVVLGVGLFVVLVLAWYHGEKGRQRVSGPEILLLAFLLVIAGGLLSTLDPEDGADQGLPPPADDAPQDISAALKRYPGIAVLPFANRSDEGSDRYFVDGVQDDLLTRLQRTPGLRVISRTSVEAYRDVRAPMRDIGRELGVSYILEGSVQRAGSRVRVNVQLIDAPNDVHVWAEVYDEMLTTETLFDIQSRIVRSVAEELHVVLREEEVLRAARRSAGDLDAYDLYLRGVDLRRGYQYAEALPLFEEAVERDPNFVAAHAELAMAHACAYQVGGLRSAERAAAALAAAERAVALAPDSEDAQRAMGIYLYRLEKDYAGALDWLTRAAGTLVGDYDYHYYRGLALKRMGRWQEALAALEACQTLAPRDWHCWTETARTQAFMRRFVDAENTAQQALERGFPNSSLTAAITRARDGTTDVWHSYMERFPRALVTWEIFMSEERYSDALAMLAERDAPWSSQNYWVPIAMAEAETLDAMGQADAAGEKYREAAYILEQRAEEAPADERFRGSLALVYAGLGRRDDAVREAQMAVELWPRDRDAVSGPHWLVHLAAVYARFGEIAEAVEVLEDVLSLPSSYGPGVLVTHHRFRSIRGDARFTALMDRERERAF